MAGVREALDLAAHSTESDVVLYFGAQWCSACRVVQQSQQLSVHLGQRPVIYVSLDIPDDGEADRSAVQAAFPTYLRSVTDAERAQLLAREFGVRSIPSFVVISAVTCQKNTDASLPLQALGADLPPVPPDTSQDGDAETSSLFAQAIARSNEGDLRGALAGFDTLLRRRPTHADAAFNVTALLQMAGHTALAVRYITMFLDLRPHDRTGHAILGTVLAETEKEAVIEALRSLASRHPDSPWAAHRLACLTGEGASAESAQAAYVQQVFDDLADSFETKLVQHLHYRVPWQLLDAVKSLVAPPCPIDPSPSSYSPPDSAATAPAGSAWWRVVDLGCGTGLCGRLFSEYTGLPRPAHAQGSAQARGQGLVIGVDLSPKMIEICRQGGAYDELKVEDVHDTLAVAYSPPLDLILSADTFIYVGRLERVFTLAAKALKQGTGLFAFSIELYAESEEPPPAGFKLVMSGRYAHTEAYIQRLASSEGFSILVRQDVTVRTEQTSPIAGIVYVLRRDL